MAKTQKITATIEESAFASVEAYAAKYAISRSEAFGRLIESGLSNLSRAEELKNLIVRQVERLEKKQELESKKGFEVLKNQAISEALTVKVLSMINVSTPEIETIKTSAVTRFISNLKD